MTMSSAGSSVGSMATADQATVTTSSVGFGVGGVPETLAVEALAVLAIVMDRSNRFTSKRAC